MCNLETEVLENLICGVSFCFFLKTTATLSWLFVMCRSPWLGLVRSKVYRGPGGTLLQQKPSSSTSQTPRMGRKVAAWLLRGDA